jgi:hypothetical protein
MFYGFIWNRIRYRNMDFSNGIETEAFIKGTIITITIII